MLKEFIITGQASGTMPEKIFPNARDVTLNIFHGYYRQALFTTEGRGGPARAPRGVGFAVRPSLLNCNVPSGAHIYLRNKRVSSMLEFVCFASAHGFNTGGKRT